MSLFDHGPTEPEPRPQPSPAARRVSRIAFALSAVLALVLVGTFVVEALPLSVRTWIAQTVPGGHNLVGLPPDPDDEIAALVERMMLTDEGRLLFVRSQPVVVDDLGELCGSDDPDEAMVTLGCYHGLGRIYLLRGEGYLGDAVLLTTAAHELLHAAYADLSDAERVELAKLLAWEIDRIPADDPVHAQIEASTDGDERSRTTEQFAYLGSQVVLPGGFDPALEDLYDRWFTDREALAGG